MSGARLESALVPARRRITALLAVLAVAVAPAAAPAQSGGAGDDQYVDPIGGSPQTQNGGGGSSGSGSSGSNGSSTAPSLSASPSLSSTQAPAAAPAATGGNTLPRTGFDAGAMAALGFTLLLMGLGLRRRLLHDRH
jgi:LPXTG-motif cell wall-anchored protein